MDGHLYRLYTCASCGYSFEAPVACGNRFCGICSGPRRRRMTAKLNTITKSLKPAPGYKVRLLTLTIPNCERASDGYKTLVGSFRKLRNRQWWRNRVQGGCYVIEITGEPGRWHVHLHALLECRYLPGRILSKIWCKVSPGKIVHIKNIPLGAGIVYVTKYISKSEVVPCHQVALSDDLKGSRLFQPFGSWHALALCVKKVNYECPTCGYHGFYWNPDECAYEKYGRAPPAGSLGRKIRDDVLLKYGHPTGAHFNTHLKSTFPWSSKNLKN